MALLEQNGGLFFFYGFDAKKVTVTMLLASSMVVVLWRKRWLEAIFFLFCGAFSLVH
jgi:hypothetical protein